MGAFMVSIIPKSDPKEMVNAVIGALGIAGDDYSAVVIRPVGSVIGPRIRAVVVNGNVSITSSDASHHEQRRHSDSREC